MKIVLPFLLLTFLSAAASAQAPQTLRAEATEYGTYTAEIAQRVPEAGSPTGTRSVVTNIHFVERTTSVPARLGTRMGIEWQIVGAPNGTSTTVTLVTRFPGPGVRNPTTGAVTYLTRRERNATVGTSILQGYGFDNSWEIVPGTWTFEIWQSGRMIGSMSFAVTSP